MQSAHSLFTGSHALKVDAKGRIAMPASLRRSPRLEAMKGFHCTPSLVSDSLDCGGPEFIERIYAMIGELDPYDPSRLDLEETLLGRAEEVYFDGDGRFILSQKLRDHAHIEDRVVIFGLGATFQIRKGVSDEVTVAPATIERARLALPKLKNPVMSVAERPK